MRLSAAAITHDDLLDASKSDAAESLGGCSAPSSFDGLGEREGRPAVGRTYRRRQARSGGFRLFAGMTGGTKPSTACRAS